jgi:hypothetical protein
MKRREMVTLASMALLSAVAPPWSSALAQQKQLVSYKTPAENIKITQQKNVDVGYVPDHIVRVYENHQTLPRNGPLIDGLRLVETWQRGITDLTDGNGSSTIYMVFVVENGDKFFVRGAAVVQTSAAGKLTGTRVGIITGGTGRLATIQGTVRGINNFDLKGGTGDSETDIEYSMGK